MHFCTSEKKIVTAKIGSYLTSSKSETSKNFPSASEGLNSQTTDRESGVEKDKVSHKTDHTDTFESPIGQNLARLGFLPKFM